MALGPNPHVALLLGLIPLAIGEALCTPVLVAALRLYSKPSQRTVAFSLFYGLMNFGFMFGYFISDGIIGRMTDGKTMTLPGFDQPISAYGVLILVSMLIDVLMFPLISLLRPGVQMTETGFVPLPAHEHRFPEGMGTGARILATAGNAAMDTLGMLGKLFRSPGFSKLVIFLLMIGLLKIVFNLMDYVLTPFTEREIGEDAVSKVGRLNATNSIMILVLAPMVGMATRKYASYTMVILGGFITASAFAFMALPSSWFEGMANGWLGRAVGNGYLGIIGEVHPYFIMIFLWQVVFSVGEAFYSPRVYEYAASIAPPGQEASYSSLSYIPLLIGKVATGLSFGGLLDRYCPAEGPRQPGMMWLIIGLMVLVAPVGLLFLKRFIRVREEGREG
jgi:MFS family permease